MAVVELYRQSMRILETKKGADADSFKAAGVMRPKTRKSIIQTQSKCLAGGYKCAIIAINIIISNVFKFKQKNNAFVVSFKE